MISLTWTDRRRGQAHGLAEGQQVIFYRIDRLRGIVLRLAQLNDLVPETELDSARPDSALRVPSGHRDSGHPEQSGHRDSGHPEQSVHRDSGHPEQSVHRDSDLQVLDARRDIDQGNIHRVRVHPDTGLPARDRPVIVHPDTGRPDRGIGLLTEPVIGDAIPTIGIAGTTTIETGGRTQRRARLRVG